MSSATVADVQGSFTSQGHNLVGIGDGGTGFGATGDQVGTVATDPANENGSLPFTFTAGPGSFNSGDVITATATLNGNTSEFSLCFVAPGAGPAVINVNEQITVTDTPTVTPSAMIGVNEQINVLDTPVVLPSAMIGVNKH